jgi:hypothetical protein
MWLPEWFRRFYFFKLPRLANGNFSPLDTCSRLTYLSLPSSISPSSMSVELFSSAATFLLSVG